MKVLFLSNSYPRPWEPLRAVFNLNLVRGLSRDHDLRVVSPVAWTERRGGLNKREAAPRGCSFPTYYFPPKIWHAYRATFMWWSLRRMLLGLVTDWHPDVVLTYWTHPDGEVALRLARRIGVPMVQIVGGSDVLIHARSGARRRRIQHVLTSADRVVTMSRDLSRAVETLGADRRRVECLYRAVDATIFHPGDRQAARRQVNLDPSRPVVLWVGRFDPVKGLDTLIESIDDVRRRLPDVLVCLVGEGAQRPRIEAGVRARGIESHFRFVGGVAHDELAAWYRSADVFTLPSRSEGVPNVLLEASACALPFVASRVGGIPEIAGELDRMVPPGDARALTEALVSALSSQPRAAVSRAAPSTEATFFASFNRLLRLAVDEFTAETAR